MHVRFGADGARYADKFGASSGRDREGEDSPRFDEPEARGGGVAVR